MKLRFAPNSRGCAQVCALMFYPLLGSRQATCSAYTLTIYAEVLPRANPARLTGRTVEVCPQQSLISNMHPYIAPRVVPSVNPTSSNTDYAFLLPCHYHCFNSIYV